MRILCILKVYFIFLTLSIFCFLPLISSAQDKLPADLPRTKDLANGVNPKKLQDGSKSKKTGTDKDVTTQSGTSSSGAIDKAVVSGEDENEVKDEKDDPTENYKLIAIYRIANQPRALIKNLDIPEETAKEFQIGDFLDESQTISVSKISFNPTARVEIVDQDGLNYLIKPSNVDSKGQSAISKTSTGSKTMPTYATGTKSRPKKADTISPTTTGTTSSTPSTETPTTAHEKKETTGSETTQAKPSSETPAAAQPPSTGQSLQAATTVSTTQTAASTAVQKAPPDTSAKPASQLAPAPGDSLDVSRPSNPFQQ